MKSAIIVDSVGYLSDDFFNEHSNVYKVNLTVNFPDGTVVVDSSHDDEIDMFYCQLNQVSELPTTSQPAVGSYYDVMEQIIADGYDVVYAIHLSSGISGTYQTAKMVMEEYSDKITTYCIDSKGASVLMEALVYETLAMIEKQEAPVEIYQKLQWLVDNSCIYLMVEDLTNLVKGGRLNAAAAVIGGVLQIRPLLYFDDEGKIVVFEKIRTNKKVFKRWSELVQDAFRHYPEGLTLAFAHGNCLGEITAVQKQIVLTVPEVSTFISQLGPVVGTHTGQGAKGMLIMPKLENYHQN